jgi:hypothetical protein
VNVDHTLTYSYTYSYTPISDLRAEGIRVYEYV